MIKGGAGIRKTNTRSLFPVRHRSPKASDDGQQEGKEIVWNKQNGWRNEERADVLYDSGGGGTVYDPPPKERKDENAGIIIENSEMAD